MKHRRIAGLAVSASVLVLAACQQDTAAPTPARAPQFDVSTSPSAAEISAMMDNTNAALIAAGADFLVAKAEYITIDSHDEAGAQILQKDVGNKHIGADFVPNDPRRGWSGPVGGSTDNITYAIDQTFDAVPPGGGLTAAQTDAAIVRAMNTWDAETCSDLALTRNGSGAFDIGVVAFQLSAGAIGSPFVFGDVQHAGWRDLNFGPGVLGVTFTFVFLSAPATPSDIDNNGLADVAFREIYYDPSFVWADNGVSNVDVQSVAVHEAGHGLSQAHFGNLFNKGGFLAASPRAVMNAAYQGPYRELKGSDNGGHCSNWAMWPNN